MKKGKHKFSLQKYCPAQSNRIKHMVIQLKDLVHHNKTKAHCVNLQLKTLVHHSRRTFKQILTFNSRILLGYCILYETPEIKWIFKNLGLL
jgi:hypothetical protein